ncbi:MAG TPA: SAM-dependent methyltransferase [Actinomycetota bacterium]|nr:SAM-dependent methyltransferase [Actinomycetota bacterium]
MTTPALSSSFRDPSGFVFVRDGRLYRQVNESFADEYDRLMASGLYQALVDDGLLVRHEEVDLELAAAPGAHRILAPEVVPFVSYPYEWCFGQLKDAATVTLRIQAKAMEFEMSLRDASAYNIQFVEGRPVLIDTLSFEPIREGEPWVAYRQFCQHFLAPLALMARVDVRLGQLLRIHVDGIPLDLAAALLPRSSRRSPGLLMHVVMHARSQAKHADDRERPATGRRGFSARAFEGLVDSLRGTVEKQGWEPGDSTWSDYYRQSVSYTEEALQHKQEVIGAALEQVGPQTVWDLGGNTGLFSRLATARGARAVCFDGDHAAVEINYRAARAEGEVRLLPLVMDLANPSPGLGWANSERPSLGDRGPADLVLALALIHHLAIGNNVPFARVAEWFAELAASLVVEFVPKQDPEVQALLVTREDVFAGYTQEGFEAGFGERFSIEDRWALRGSDRTVYLMRRR